MKVLLPFTIYCHKKDCSDNLLTLGDWDGMGGMQGECDGDGRSEIGMGMEGVRIGQGLEE